MKIHSKLVIFEQKKVNTPDFCSKMRSFWCLEISYISVLAKILSKKNLSIISRHLSKLPEIIQYNLHLVEDYTVYWSNIKNGKKILLKIDFWCTKTLFVQTFDSVQLILRNFVKRVHYFLWFICRNVKIILFIENNYTN